jgi:3-dehydroquinate synthase
MSNEIKSLKISQLLAELKLIETDTLILIVDPIVKEKFPELFNFSTFSQKVILWSELGGEAVKNLTQYERCTELLLSEEVHRRAHVVAIGGGAISDFAGFVASTLLRGISWSVVPTTLLSMVDAALGGKVGLNSAVGKNLIGAFHHPDSIYLCSEFLKTLSSEDMQSGKGEILKYAFLTPAVASRIQSIESIDEIILECLKYKQMIVRSDPTEQGERKLLNLGHTLGHGLERRYGLSHGVAVGWGLAMMMIAQNCGEIVESLKLIAHKIGFQTHEQAWHREGLDLEGLMGFVRKDKKKVNVSEIDIIVPISLGESVIKKILLSDFEDSLIKRKAELETFRF